MEAVPITASPADDQKFACNLNSQHSRRRINIGAVKQWVSWQEWRFCAIVMQTLARLSIRNLLLITPPDGRPDLQPYPGPCEQLVSILMPSEENSQSMEVQMH
jgi:hypothetical protein